MPHAYIYNLSADHPFYIMLILAEMIDINSGFQKRQFRNFDRMPERIWTVIVAEGGETKY